MAESKKGDRMLNAALSYAKKGFSVLPIKPATTETEKKMPYVKWLEFQTRKATPEEIKAWWTKFPDAMVGIVTGEISGVSVVDIDNHEAEEELQKYIPESLTCPTATTPRGGKHLYFKTPTPPLDCNIGAIKGSDFRGQKGYIIAPPSVNGNNKAYNWINGLSISEIELPELPSSYISYIYNNNIYKKSIYSKEDSHNKSQQVTDSHIILADGTRDDDLFHVANCLTKGGMNDNIMYQVLEKLAYCCKPEFPVEIIPIKIKSAMKRAERRERNLSEEVRKFVEVTDGHFLVTDCHSESQIVTKEEKHAVIVELQRLVKEGVIEKFGDKRGCYRKINKDETEIDIFSEDSGYLDIKYPFGLEKLVVTMPKNIFIIAGSTNSGKSAFLLNFAKLNLDKHKVYYFSSEMGAMEMKSRIKNFSDYQPELWKKLKIYERAGDFADVIRPDDINIIDYLEINTDFFRMGEFIRNIFDKLKKGIAFIAIQKMINRDEGRGGLGSVEKSRLYLAMEFNKLKIVKAKNWANQTVNPNKLETTFNLMNGVNFIQQSDWEQAEENRTAEPYFNQRDYHNKD